MYDFKIFQRQDNLKLRARIIDSIRQFFSHNNYLEIETPVRIPAPAPETYIDAQSAGEWWLQTSPELCMKRLIAAGFPRIFQISRCFRNGERGDRHLPEFTLLEWYCAEQDYRYMMKECEQLIGAVAMDLNAGLSLSYQGQIVDLTPPWTRLSVAEAFERFASIPMATALSEGRFDEVIAEEIEPMLGQGAPLFLYDYPASSGALARLKSSDPTVAERFELYVCGLELCNAFSELTDPVEQSQRFRAEAEERYKAGKPVYNMPEKFLRSLEFMPSATGNALGVDRLAMLFADAVCIDDVVAFTPEEL